MNVLKGLVYILLLVVISTLIYIGWSIAPIGEKVDFEKYSAEVGPQIEKTTQFYPNLRFRDREINYFISSVCLEEKIKIIEKAFEIIENLTILDFNSENSNPEIFILCSDLSPTAEEENHFIAGEGGPSKIINASKYNVIFSSRVSLYRGDNCENPNVAIHEIFHALGFDHNANPQSIMYNVSNCNQKIDQSLVKEIEVLYSVESLPDLVITEIVASKEAVYLNANITVMNIGLKDSLKSTILLYWNDEKIREINISDVEIGIRKTLKLENLRVSRGLDSLKVQIKTAEREISDKNNEALIRI